VAEFLKNLYTLYHGWLLDRKCDFLTFDETKICIPFCHIAIHINGEIV
jgi:hypothetical protein